MSDRIYITIGVFRSHITIITSRYCGDIPVIASGAAAEQKSRGPRSIDIRVFSGFVIGRELPGTDTQAVVSPGTASRSSHPRFTGRHGTRMSPATVGTEIFPPRNSASAHGEGAFTCCLLLRHKNETIPHITDMQDHSLHVAQSCPTKKALRKGPRERKTGLVERLDAKCS